MTKENNQPNDLTQFKREVLIHVGRNLALYQKIEYLLKAILPHLSNKSFASNSDAFAEINELLRSKTTMGPLMEMLKGSVECEHPEGFAKYLESVVSHRNELAHHFFQIPVGRMKDESSYRDACSYLQDRYNDALPLNNLLKSLVEEFADMLEQHPADRPGVTKETP